MKNSQYKSASQHGRSIDLRNYDAKQVQHTESSVPQAKNSPQPQKPAKKKKNTLITILLIVFAFGLIAGGVYIFILMHTPKIQKASPQKVQSVLEEIKKSDKNTLFIASAGVYTPVLEGGPEQLDNGLLHRVPKNGDPEAGGNFVVSGHSFVWGYTPKQVREKSVFYNLSDVKMGDEIIAYWNKKFYHYKVTELKTVKPNAIEIENKTKDPTLTVYTCTPGGSADGRVVVIAKPSI
ncbi:sortase [Candidatus Saccharibacteria bacterium]|nr:sortase [Candidatus Saccharibacteria bacterium]